MSEPIVAQAGAAVEDAPPPDPFAPARQWLAAYVAGGMMTQPGLEALRKTMPPGAVSLRVVLHRVGQTGTDSDFLVTTDWLAEPQSAGHTEQATS